MPDLIADRAKVVHRSARELRKLATATDPKDLRAIQRKLAALQKDLDHLKALFRPDSGGEIIPSTSTDTAAGLQESTPFSDFLSNIGESVVRSQQQLDQRSTDYLTSIRDRPYIPPTLFRIPTIKAELKVALERSESTGLNVILFSTQSEMSELNQQSLQFEIAAVPPSPELLGALQDSIPRIDFVFDREERNEVFDLVAELGEGLDPKFEDQLEKIVDEKNRDGVIIWSSPSKNRFLILFAEKAAGQTAEHGVCIWYLDKSNDTLESVIRLDLKAKSGENQEPLKQFVLDLGKKQQILFGGVSPDQPSNG